MTVIEVARRHYERRQFLAGAAARRAGVMWGRLDRDDLSGSWLRSAPDLAALVVTAQLTAAALADPYLDGVLAEQGVDPDGLRVNPAALAGTASDGRPLATLLHQPVIETKVRARSQPFDRAFASGLASVQRIVATQVQDAGRVADGVAAMGRPRVQGYIRYLSPPSCSRCAVLAGRWYRVSAGFQRHPR